MSLTLQIALVQTDLFWESPKENCNQLTVQLAELPNTVDLIVLPEMFTTGFSMEPTKLYETMDGPTVKWMQELAKQKAAAVMGSLIIKDQEQFFNRLLFVEPSGAITSYDKEHGFSVCGEDKVSWAWSFKTVGAL